MRNPAALFLPRGSSGDGVGAVSLCLPPPRNWGTISTPGGQCADIQGYTTAFFSLFFRNMGVGEENVHRRWLLRPACTHKTQHFLRNQRSWGGRQGETSLGSTQKRANRVPRNISQRPTTQSPLPKTKLNRTSELPGGLLEFKHPQRNTAPLPRSAPKRPTAGRLSLLWDTSPCSSFSFSSYGSGTRF